MVLSVSIIVIIILLGVIVRLLDTGKIIIACNKEGDVVEIFSDGQSIWKKL
jgi:hypothetical protein